MSTIPPNKPLPDPAERLDEVSPSVVENDSAACNWAMAAHLAAPASIALGIGVLGLGFLASLVIWMIKRREFSFVDYHGKEAVNFNMTMFLWYLVAIAITTATCGALFFVMFIPAILQICFGIYAAIQASSGRLYRYPMTMRLIKGPSTTGL